MFKLKRQQKEALRLQAICDFEDRVLEHVERCFPDRLRSLGEATVREVIHQGVGRAATYGIYLERDVCKFIDLMLVLGMHFDRELAWASEILGAPLPKEPSVKLGRLFERAMEAP